MHGKYRAIDFKIYVMDVSNFYYFEYKFEYKLYLYYLSTHVCHLLIYAYNFQAIASFSY